MKTRHDSTDDDVIAVQAKKELADVNAMQTTLPTMQSSLNDISDAYADALGKGAVTALRADADQAIQLEGLRLTQWWRAINDITDSLNKVSGASDVTGENIEQHYDESSDYNTRAATRIQELTRQRTELQSQLQERIDGAKRDLAAIRGRADLRGW
jgi:hypothetical protein